jgi:hypothetical protein
MLTIGDSKNVLIITQKQGIEEIFALQGSVARCVSLTLTEAVVEPWRCVLRLLRIYSTVVRAPASLRV